MDETEKKSVNFTVVPDDDVTVKRIYSNFCSVQNSPFDFTLTFCEMLPIGEREVQQAQVRAWHSAVPLSGEPFGQALE